MKRRKTAAIFSLSVFMLITACTGGLFKSPSKDPVILTVITSFDDDYKKRHFIDLMSFALKEKFPSLLFDFYDFEFLWPKYGTKTSTFPRANYGDFVKEGYAPDLIVESLQRVVPNFVSQGHTMDLSAIVKSYNINLSTFQPELLDHVRAWSGNGELYALPLFSRLYGLFYDKDAVAQGKLPSLHDGMTWDDVIAAAEADGSMITPPVLDTWNSIESQFRLLHVNPETEQVDVQSGAWEEALRLYGKLPLDSGNLQMESFFPGSSNVIGHIAMANWDIFSYPQVADHPDWGPNSLGEVVSVGPQGAHQEEAKKVMAYLVSDEFQLTAARYGFPSVLNNPDTATQFGADNPDYAGKNVKAFFALPTTVLPSRISIYDHTANSGIEWSLLQGLIAGWGPLRSGEDLELVQQRMDREMNLLLEAGKKAMPRKSGS